MCNICCCCLVNLCKRDRGRLFIIAGMLRSNFCYLIFFSFFCFSGLLYKLQFWQILMVNSMKFVDCFFFLGGFCFFCSCEKIVSLQHRVSCAICSGLICGSLEFELVCFFSLVCFFLLIQIYSSVCSGRIDVFAYLFVFFSFLLESVYALSRATSGRFLIRFVTYVYV